MHIYLIRHGESIGNAKGIHQGQKNDFSLSALGRKQSYFLKKRFEHLKIDAIYSSDLRRAKETAEIISESKRLIPLLDKRLRERDFGLIGEEKNLMSAWNAYLQQHASQVIPPREVTPPDGESDKDHFDRVHSFFEDLKKKHCEDDSIIIVAHGGTNKVALGVLGHFSLDEMYKTPQGNACINEIVFKDGFWSVSSLNCMKHIEIDPDIIDAFVAIRDNPLDVIKNRCWEKHLKLKEMFDKKGYVSKFHVCSFYWSEQKLPREIIRLPHEDIDYHLFLIVKIHGLKLIVDASNDSMLPSTNVWDARSNCALAVIPKEFIEEDIEGIINKKIHQTYSKNHLAFLNAVNSFLREARGSKSTLLFETK